MAVSRFVPGCFGLLVAALAAPLARGQAYPLERMSVDSSGVAGNNQSGGSQWSPVSADGRYVAFESNASNLVAGDTNNANDIFVHDRLTGATVRMSVDSAGVQGNRDCQELSISRDGRFVAFRSWSTNLDSRDKTAWSDVFVRDRDPDGNGIFDEGNGTTEVVSLSTAGVIGNRDSYEPAISGDGSLVVFASDANNLVATDKNGSTDVFVHDRRTGTTTLVSLSSSGTQGNRYSTLPSISADGTTVAYESKAFNLVSGDNNNVSDVFVTDLASGTTTRISVKSDGTEGDGRAYGPPSLSDDGRYIAFHSEAKNIVDKDKNGSPDVFIYDQSLATTTRVSLTTAGVEGNGLSAYPVLSSDGQVVVWESAATNFSASDDNAFTDVYVRDLATGVTSLVSVNGMGVAGSDFSQRAGLSADGRIVAFRAKASNLVSDDHNGVTDILVRDRAVHEPVASDASFGAGFAGTLGEPSLDASAAPIFGTTVTLGLGCSSPLATVGVLLFGFARADLPTTKGGRLLVDADFGITLAIPPGGTTLDEVIPDDDFALYGLVYDLQLLELDAGAAKGVAFSRGLELVLGIP